MNHFTVGEYLGPTIEPSFIFSTQYLSDVGGSAGLILGISAATLLGLFEDGVFFMVVQQHRLQHFFNLSFS